MVSEPIKQRIRDSYRQFLQARQLQPRNGQRQMIAEIARTLSQQAEAGEGPLCVVEAGTGIGKTLAYLLAAIPLAQARDLKLVVATATIALQEQLVLKDIPQLQQAVDMDFSFTLAKGRSRYLCLAQLDNQLHASDSLQAMLDLYGEDLPSGGESVAALYQQLQDALEKGSWDGDRDDWPEPLNDQQWRPVTVNSAQCLGSRCRFFKQCCFYQARDKVTEMDVIVANQDLVLSDLALGGGAILPAPQDSIYIFDEAHHLADKSNRHFASFATIPGTLKWLDKVPDMAGRLVKERIVTADLVNKLVPLHQQCREGLEQLSTMLQQIISEQQELDSYGTQSRLPFPLGQIPPDLQQMVATLVPAFQQLDSGLQKATNELTKLIEQATDSEQTQQAELWFPIVGNLQQRAESTRDLLDDFAAEQDETGPPTARWLTINELSNDADIGLAVSPVLAAGNLQQSLWSQCAGAVLTSATLSALGSFELFTIRTGLPERTRYLRIPSPFRFAEVASLHVPRMHCQPRDTAAHTAAIVKALPELLPAPVAALMLFSSRRQMQEVLEKLPKTLHKIVLCQDDHQKARLLEHHRQRIDAGEDSLIFGLASFAEGVDLPGAYCTHVLIAKIPFQPPNEPVEKTLAQWLEQQGQNPFTALTVPDAALRLVQASGRLLRNETDSGRITLFDERIVQQRYGKQILESLPPYRREIFTEQL